MAKFVLKGVTERDLEGSTLVTGFRTIGEVGYLAVRHIALSGGFERVGFIETKYIRDVVSVDEYGVAAPFEIFFNKENKIVLILNHILPYQREWNSFTRSIVDWMKKVGIKEGIYIGGLDRRYSDGASKLRWLKTSASERSLSYPYMEKQLFIVGPLALLTLYSEIKEFPAVVLLPYADRDRTDPAAAATAVEVVNELLGIKVETSMLYEEAKKIEEELQKQMELLQKELFRGGSERIYM